MSPHTPLRADVPVLSARKAEIAKLTAGSMSGRRIAVSSVEPEDAHLTGMTRSLDRRLLALNLKPSTSVAHVSALKVA